MNMNMNEKKKPARIKKLELNRETLAQLDRNELEKVAGGSNVSVGCTTNTWVVNPHEGCKTF